MRLVLVRHGETIWNAEGRIHGRADIELSDRGKEQAKNVSQMLALENPVKIFSSTLKRAVKTAELIALPHSMQVEQRHELDEIDYGVFEGVSFRELDQDEKLGKLWADRRKDKYNFTPPEDGESFHEMDEKRIKPFVKEMLEKYSKKTVIIVAHSGTNRLIAGNCLHLPVEKMVKIWQPNDCVYFIDCSEKKCFYSHQILGSDKPKTGYLTVEDIKKWEDMFK